FRACVLPGAQGVCPAGSYGPVCPQQRCRVADSQSPGAPARARTTNAMSRAELNSDRPPRRASSPPPEAAARAYIVLCLAALVGILLAQLDQGVGLGSLLVLMVGVLGVVSRLQSGPLLLLLVLGIQLFLRQRMRPYYRAYPGTLSSLEGPDVV